MYVEGISDIKITGLDPLRPPKLQKIPCIDLVFTLSHKAPKGWCEFFNNIMGKQTYSVRIDPEAGLFVETWVRKPGEIEKLLDTLKQGVIRCSDTYIADLEAKARQRAIQANPTGGDGPSAEQLALDAIVLALDFDA